jgi:hypothetical protein
VAGDVVSLAEQIAALRGAAIEFLDRSMDCAGTFDRDADADGFCDQEPHITLTFNVERTTFPWQAAITYCDSMGEQVAIAGDSCAAPEDTIDSLRVALATWSVHAPCEGNE